MGKAGEVAAYWQGHAAGWRASGESQKAYCARNGLKAGSLSYWHRRLAKESGTVVAAAPVTLVPATIAPVAPHSGPSLSLCMPGGWRLEFAALPAADWLRALCGERR